MSKMASEPPSDQAWQEELDAEAAFIDDDWLKGLKQFRIGLSLSRPDGKLSKDEYNVIGVLGHGTASVVFDAKDAQGNAVALKMLRKDWSFASYIRELPPGMSLDRYEGQQRLRSKIERLYGDPMLDRIVGDYDHLYRSLVDNLHDWPPFDQIKWNSEEAAQVMSFGVRMPGTIAKLSQLASASTSRPETAAWAERTLGVLGSIKVDPVLLPEILPENPLYVWGGAILSGYVDIDSIDARSCVCSRLTSQPGDLETFVAQGWAVAHLLRLFQIPGEVNFAKFWQASCDGLSVDGGRLLRDTTPGELFIFVLLCHK